MLIIQSCKKRQKRRVFVRIKSPTNDGKYGRNRMEVALRGDALGASVRNSLLNVRIIDFSLNFRFAPTCTVVARNEGIFDDGVFHVRFL